MWFQMDVARILGATFKAMQATAAAGASGEHLDCYQEGFHAALRAVAAGFGLSDPATLEYDPYERRSSPRLTIAEPATGYRLDPESQDAPHWRDSPADDRHWTGRVVDGEVMNTRRAYP